MMNDSNNAVHQWGDLLLKYWRRSCCSKWDTSGKCVRSSNLLIKSNVNNIKQTKQTGEEIKHFSDMLAPVESSYRGGFGGSSWFLGQILFLWLPLFGFHRFNRISLNKPETTFKNNEIYHVQWWWPVNNAVCQGRILLLKYWRRSCCSKWDTSGKCVRSSNLLIKSNVNNIKQTKQTGEEIKHFSDMLAPVESSYRGGFGGSSWFLGQILFLCHLPFELHRFNRISLNKSKSC